MATRHGCSGELLDKTWSEPLPTNADNTAGIAYTYTRTGALASVTDPATGLRTFDYDAQGLMPARENLPAYYENRTITYTYELGGGNGLPGGFVAAHSQKTAFPKWALRLRSTPSAR